MAAFKERYIWFCLRVSCLAVNYGNYCLAEPGRVVLVGKPPLAVLAATDGNSLPPSLPLADPRTLRAVAIPVPGASFGSKSCILNCFKGCLLLLISGDIKGEPIKL